MRQGSKVRSMDFEPGTTCLEERRQRDVFDARSVLTDRETMFRSSSDITGSDSSTLETTNREHEQCTSVLRYEERSDLDLSRTGDERLILKLSWEADSLW